MYLLLLGMFVLLIIGPVLIILMAYPCWCGQYPFKMLKLSIILLRAHYMLTEIDERSTTCQLLTHYMLTELDERSTIYQNEYSDHCFLLGNYMSWGTISWTVSDSTCMVSRTVQSCCRLGLQFLKLLVFSNLGHLFERFAVFIICFYSGRLFRKIELSESIRYASRDPIESWLNALLCLDVTNSIPSIRRSELSCWEHGIWRFLHHLHWDLCYETISINFIDLLFCLFAQLDYPHAVNVISITSIGILSFPITKTVSYFCR